MWRTCQIFPAVTVKVLSESLAAVSATKRIWPRFSPLINMFVVELVCAILYLIAWAVKVSQLWHQYQPTFSSNTVNNRPHRHSSGSSLDIPLLFLWLRHGHGHGAVLRHHWLMPRHYRFMPRHWGLHVL